MIVFIHSLEHFPNPREDIEAVLRHLAPGGYLLVQVPNAASRIASISGVMWNWYIPPLHISYFSKGSLVQVMRTLSIEPVWDATDGPGCIPFLEDLLLSPANYALRMRKHPAVASAGCDGDEVHNSAQILGKLANVRRRIDGLAMTVDSTVRKIRPEAKHTDRELTILFRSRSQ
jgi:hypothetical protein